MKKRVHEDSVVEMWDRLGPAGGFATPHIPLGSAADALTAFVNASTAQATEAWTNDRPQATAREWRVAHAQGHAIS